MKIVNNSGVPEVLFNALKHNWYTGEGEKRDWSVTELLDPVKVSILKKRYDDDIEKDALENLWSLMGSAMHIVLEKGSMDKEHLGLLVEKRLGMDILGKHITGGMDIYDQKDKCIIDFKFQTVWNWIYLDDHIDNLKFQLNAYRILLKANGYDVEKMKVIFVFRDWREYEISRIRDYPDTQFKELDIEVIPDEEMMKLLEEKVANLEKYKDTPDDEIPICSKEERWQKEDSWKIMYKNKAIKTFYTEQEAIDFVNEKHYGEIRYTQEMPKRCPKYCAGRDYCNFYLNEIKPLLEKF